MDPTDLQAPANPEEPDEQPMQEAFAGELVYPQEQREVQLTLGPSADWCCDRAWDLPLTVEYGLTDAWQVEVEWTSLASIRAAGHDRATGIGDLSGVPARRTRRAFRAARGARAAQRRPHVHDRVGPLAWTLRRDRIVGNGRDGLRDGERVRVAGEDERLGISAAGR